MSPMMAGRCSVQRRALGAQGCEYRSAGRIPARPVSGPAQQHRPRTHGSTVQTCALPVQQVKGGKVMASETATILLGDIGGTNARFEVVTANLKTGERKGESTIKFYQTSKFATFQSALRELFCETNIKTADIASCCLAVAGPVSRNKCSMTNLGWVIDGEEIEDEFGFRTQVLNDFEAIGYGIPTLTNDEVVPLTDNVPIRGGPIAVLGPGTGLGTAQLMWDTGLDDYKVWASEGSHADFAPRGALQRQLQEFAEQELELPCEIEHVACGTGLKRIYRFLCMQNGKPVESLEPAEVSQRALANSCSICSQAVDIFLEIVGAEAGAMALRSLATGGVFITGGIPPKLIDRIQDGNLLASFLNTRSRFSKVVSQFPLFVVMNDGVGLKGVYQYAVALAQQKR